MLEFKKIILHNFGSYNHAEVDLANKGFCLVTGRNNYAKDNAYSNGSGKSLIWSAICFAITGETINGVRSGLKNINVEENSGYVSLDAEFDGDTYLLTRYIAPKSELKIIKNGVDVSGKTFRESEKRLGELIPTINKDLIASTIIIGQGMPNRFSAFSPSGRKDILEKLTNSDYMIEDIKDKLSKRQTTLNSELRKFEDSLLVNNTQLKTIESDLTRVTNELAQLNKPDFKLLLESLNTQLTKTKEGIEANNKAIQENTNTIAIKQDELNKTIMSKSTSLTEIDKKYNDELLKANTQKISLEQELKTLAKEISDAKNIKEFCPTCHQKLPGVFKPDTQAKETLYTNKYNELQNIINKISTLNSNKAKEEDEVSKSTQATIDSLNKTISDLKNSSSYTQNILTSLIQEQATIEGKINEAKFDETNWDKKYNGLVSEKTKLQKSESEYKNLVNLAEIGKANIQEHLAVIKKMITISSRDFRGYLLSNIIAYLDKKAKEYSQVVFGTSDLNIYLDGNALDITYCDKMFDNLSGGEKQRVDLILQFAIRNMLNSYLNIDSNILVLDEITDFLDKQSCAAVMKLIENELNTTESVFIVSHHAEALELPIDSELKIIKNSEGISEVY